MAAEADPVYAYANGLAYGGYALNGYAGYAAHHVAPAYATYAAATPVAHATYAAAAPVVAPATYAAAAPLAHATYAAAAPAVVAPAVAAAPVVAPAASAYALPPTQIVNEAPIVEQVVEPVEQWGYKVAY